MPALPISTIGFRLESVATNLEEPIGLDEHSLALVRGSRRFQVKDQDRRIPRALDINSVTKSPSDHRIGSDTVRSRLI